MLIENGEKEQEMEIKVIYSVKKRTIMYFKIS
jgi:hypothetical protein